MNPAIITLLTDFGTQDYFVAAMKGVILSANPRATIVDITHEIPPQDIHAGAFTLLSTYKEFPAGTIHVAVVDPGVGSDRRPIVIECAGQFFIGPDNGLFGWICEREGRFSARQVTSERLFKHPKSATFHGRDVFAPVAAALSNGVALDELGDPVRDPVKLESLKPRKNDDGTFEGAIIHIDRFGNCITNFTADDLHGIAGGKSKLLVNNHEINSLRTFFSEPGTPSATELFMILGSAGFIELAVQNSSAASILKVRPGQPVQLRTDDKRG